MHVQLLRQGLDGHSWSQGQDQRLEKQSKPAALARPGDWNQVDATGVAVNPWDPGRKVSLILKEIEMSPGFFSSVMNFLPFCPAFGTAEFRVCSLKILSKESKYVKIVA